MKRRYLKEQTKEGEVRNFISDIYLRFRSLISLLIFPTNRTLMYKFSSLILNEHNSRCLSNCMVNKYCLRFLIRRHEFRNQVGMLTQLLFCIENTDLVLESSPG